MPLYDFVCDTCGARLELVVPMAKRAEPVPHSTQESDCPGQLIREAITAVHVRGAVFLDGRHQMKAIAYDGERKVGYVDGHFGKAAKRRR